MGINQNSTITNNSVALPSGASWSWTVTGTPSVNGNGNGTSLASVTGSVSLQHGNVSGKNSFHPDVSEVNITNSKNGAAGFGGSGGAGRYDEEDGDIYTRVSASATLLINEQTLRYVSEGKKVYKFGFGQSPFLPPPHVVAELKRK